MFLLIVFTLCGAATILFALGSVRPAVPRLFPARRHDLPDITPLTCTDALFGKHKVLQRWPLPMEPPAPPAAARPRSANAEGRGKIAG
jgi:hypothetical protein